MPFPSNIYLAPLSAVYGAVTRMRLALYRAGVLKTRNVGVPVISVGNITTGGTGKTPFVAWLARRLATEGYKACILTRGYGRTNSSRQVVVSDGQRLMAGAADGGDEPRLLAESLVGIAAVISNADRVSAAKWAIENLKSNLFILDDAFQHLGISRDLNLVTIDSINPWGGRKLLPRGRLREPMTGLARADAIMLTRADCAHDIDMLRSEAQRLSNDRPVLVSKIRTTRIVLLNTDLTSNERKDVAEIPLYPELAFCALGNPTSFFSHASGDGHQLVATESFPDHHVYTQSDIDALSRKARTHGAQSLLTTAKDAVKLRDLRFDIPCYVLEIEMIVDDEELLLKLLDQAVQMASKHLD